MTKTLAAVQAAIEYVRALFRPRRPIISEASRGAVEPTPLALPAPQFVASERKARAKPDRSKPAFKRDILDQLDKFFPHIEGMKKGDKQAYDQYSRVGCQIVASDNNLDLLSLEPYWLANRPAFGCVFTQHNYDTAVKGDTSIFPRFMYYTKYNKKHAPLDVQPVRKTAGEVYICSAFWDEPANGKHDAARFRSDFSVLVEPNGEVRVLKMKLSQKHTVHTKRSRGGMNGSYSIPSRKWGHHNFYRTWAQEHGLGVEEHLKLLFVFTANSYVASAREMVQVRATKNKATAVFSINPTITPRFFEERIKTPSSSGSAKPVFHSVRTHRRVLADGRDSSVKMHFRGERSFAWNDYQIDISVPYREHFDYIQVDVAAVEYAEGDDALERGSMPMQDLVGILEHERLNGRRFEPRSDGQSLH